MRPSGTVPTFESFWKGVPGGKRKDRGQAASENVQWQLDVARTVDETCWNCGGDAFGSI